MYFWLEGSLTFSNCRKRNETFLFPGAIVDAFTLQVNRMIPQAPRDVEGTCTTCFLHFACDYL